MDEMDGRLALPLLLVQLLLLLVYSFSALLFLLFLVTFVVHTVPRIVLCSRFQTTNDEGLARSLHLSVPRHLKGPQSVLVLWSKVRHCFDRYLPSGFHH